VEPFDRLHPAVQYHVVNSLGWKSLRPTQLEAISPILDGRNCLLLAPTAGGKTEAAIIPVFSRMIHEDWQGLSVLYVCPIKALLNNLDERLSRYASMFGRRVQVWHGDVSQSAKARALRDHPDIVLTTPESLEAMLISTRVDRPAWFSNLRTVIVDELHAFAADDRGWHLRAVLHRIDGFASAPLQRLGLSATVGNPEALLKWLSPMNGIVVGQSEPSTEADVTIDYVGSLENAATVIARYQRGYKRLVFCDSRARVEELASRLRALNTRTFVSHASLSVDERRQAEKAFGEERDCVIVATSTLELGIDVGDLDNVIQIDAPGSVSSFLQRMGRTGRRAGSRRNYLFLTTSDEAHLLACAIARLWMDRFVEDIVPPPDPWHVVAQQAIALCLRTCGILHQDLRAVLLAAFPELAASDIEALLVHMVAAGVLNDDQSRISLGEKGERLYGRQHFLDVLSVFSTPLQFVVRHGTTELGYVDPVSMTDGKAGPRTLLLSGRSWKIQDVDWKGRLVWVVPGDERGKAHWIGTSRSLAFPVCQAIRDVLVTPPISGLLSKRGLAKLAELQELAPGVIGDYKTLEHVDGGLCRWWTFAGGKANALLAAQQKGPSGARRSDNLSIELDDPPDFEVGKHSETTLERIAAALAISLPCELKFSECLPRDLKQRTLISRYLDIDSARSIVQRTAQPHA